MMRIKQGLWMFLFAALSACGTAPAKGADGAAQTQIVATFAAQLTETAVRAPIEIEPEDAESPEETETPFVTPTPDAGTLLLGRFRTVTVSKGNLFVRDGMGVPVQITKSGTDHDPIISSDGQKIVFYRGEKFNSVFVVNADGSGEKELINKKLLPVLGDGSIKHLAFQPRTYSVFFNTYVCKDICELSIFILDTALAKATELARGINRDESLGFDVSPDGQYLLVQNPSQIDLYNMKGEIIHPAIIQGFDKASYWLADSRSLIALITTRGLYTIWRYNIKDNEAAQISIVPQPLFDEDIACYIAISPDRNLILYQDQDHQKYIANLTTLQSRPYAWNSDCHVQWSPDSQHFASQTAIGSVDGTSPIKLDGHFIAWLDSTHYLFSKGTGILDLQTYIAEVGKESAAVPTNFIWSPVYAVLP